MSGQGGRRSEGSNPWQTDEQMRIMFHSPADCAVPPRWPTCTAPAGKYVELKDPINDFKGVLEGKYDDLPEMAFYMVSAFVCESVA